MTVPTTTSIMALAALHDGFSQARVPLPEAVWWVALMCSVTSRDADLALRDHLAAGRVDPGWENQLYLQITDDGVGWLEANFALV